MTKTVIVLLAAALSASAHHSFGAEYDANKPIKLTGVVTKVEWTNPHSFFYLDVKDASGKVANWKLEGFPPNVLYRTGWKKDVTLKQGDEITVTARPSRVPGEYRALMLSLKRPLDGFTWGTRAGEAVD